MPKRFFFTALAILSLFLIMPPAFGQEASCTVILKNGNAIRANSYRVEGGRIYLQYPVGKASFDLSKVMSVTRSDGKAESFQDKGRAQARDKDAFAGPARTGASFGHGGRPEAGRADIAPEPAFPAGTSAGDGPVSAKEREQKFSDFFEKYWQADEKTQEEMSAQMDKVFSDYLDPESGSHE